MRLMMRIAGGLSALLVVSLVARLARHGTSSELDSIKVKLTKIRSAKESTPG